MSLFQTLSAKVLALSGAIPLFLAPPSLAQSDRNRLPQFFDISGHWAEACIEGIGSDELMKGYPDGRFRPNGTMTRAEFAAVIVKAFPDAPVVRSAPDFADVAQSFWGKAAIASAYERGFLTGYPGNLFKPAQAISRAQAMIIIANTQAQLRQAMSSASDAAVLNQFFQDALEIPSYARSGIAQATRNGFVVNYPDADQLKPNNNITRGEATALLCRVNEAGTEARHYVADDYVAAFGRQFNAAGFSTADSRPNSVLLRDFGSAYGDALFGERIVMGETLFFIDNREDRLALWKTTGSATDTQKVRSLEADPNSDRPISMSGASLLGSDDEQMWILTQPDYQSGDKRRVGLWRSDGTSTSTQEVSSFSSKLSEALTDAERVYAGGHSAHTLSERLPLMIRTQADTQLWITDGKSEAGTRRLFTFKNAPDNERTFPSQQFAITDEYVLFIATATPSDTASGAMALWRTDGTPEGTTSLKTINGLRPSEFVLPWQNRAYFTAGTPETGKELWVSDGTQAGTTILKDIYPGADNSDVSIIGHTETALFMLANSPDGLALWTTEGTPESTRMIKQLGGRSQQTSTGSVLYEAEDGKIFFSALADDSDITEGTLNFELWVSDGTAAGTQPLGKRLGSALVEAATFKGKLFFSASSLDGRELWVSDGSPQGTRQLTDLTPGLTQVVAPCPMPPPGTESRCPPPANLPNGTFPRAFVVQGDLLYFMGGRNRLFRTDGSVKGMELVAALNQADRYALNSIARLGEQIVFMTQGDRPQLWATSALEPPMRATFLQQLSPSPFSIDYPADWYVKDFDQNYVSIWNQQPSRVSFPPGFIKTEMHLRSIKFEDMVREDETPARGGYDSGTLTKTERLTIGGKAAFRTFFERGENGEDTIVTLIRYSDTQTAQLVSYFTTGETESIATIQEIHQSFRAL